MERDLLFCLQALQLGLVERGLLQEAGRGWSEGRAGLREEVLRRAALSAEDVALLERSVELLVRAHGGDERAAAESLGGARRIAETLADSLRVEATLPRSEQPDATLPRRESAGAPVASLEEGEVTAEAPGRYVVRGEQGRGGIGRVLVAFDEHVGREVAIKELLVGEGSGTPASGPRTIASVRFLREARLTAQLEHPSIVPVHEVGRRADGTLYYAMRLVRGRTLAQALHSLPGVGERLGLLPHFADLCAAVAFAHSRGVLHRDLKPHNVMIGEFSETVLLDWGLAKLKGSEREDRRFAKQMEALRDVAAGKTIQGEALGTPEYMPPEQAWGDLDRVDERSDVYSLGAVLYELLTGHPPFTGRGALEILTRVQRYGEGKEELAPVRSLEPSAPPELAAVAEKALCPQPHGRYAGAKELLEEINAFMAGRRVGAYQYSSLELLRRFIAQNRAVSALAALLLVSLIAGSGVLARAWREAEAGRERARAAELKVHRHLASAYAEKGARLAAERDYLGARVFAAAALSESPFNPLGLYPDPSAIGTPEADAALASLQSTLWAARHEGRVRRTGGLSGHDGTVEIARFSPDGSRIATGGPDRVLRVFSKDGGEAVHRLGLPANILALAWSPDGEVVAAGGGSSLLRAWRPGEASALELKGHGDAVTAVAFSPDGRLLASVSRDRTLRLWDPGRGLELARLTAPTPSDDYWERVAFSPDGARLASAGTDGKVYLWDVAGRRLATVLQGHEGALVGVLFAPAGELWTLGSDRTLRRWDPAKGEELDSVGLGEGQHRGLAGRFDADGCVLLAVGRDEAVELWDPQAGERAGVVHGHGGQVRAVAFSPDGRTLLSAGADRRAHLWAVAARTARGRLTGHEAPVAALALAPDGRRLLSGARDRTLRVWDLLERRLVAVWDAHDAELSAVAWAADGTLVSAARDGTIRLWDGPGSAPRATLSAPGVRMMASLSTAGGVLAVPGSDGKVRLYRLADGSLTATLDAGTESVTAVAFAPDGRTLASGGRDKVVRLWDVAAGALARSFPVPERIRSLAFAPDGATLAVGDQAWTVRLLDAAKGGERGVLRGHHDAPRTLSFSRDGRLLATAGAADTTVRLWELPSGRLLQVIDLVAETRAALLLPDSAAVAAADGSAIALAPLALDLWKAPPGPMLEEAERDAAMQLEGFALVPR